MICYKAELQWLRLLTTTYKSTKAHPCDAPALTLPWRSTVLLQKQDTYNR